MTSNSPAEQPQNQIPEIKRKHDLFEDPALAKALDEDPIARFLLTNWKNMLVCGLALFAGFYIWSQIKSTTNDRVLEASETFDQARTSVMRLIDSKKKEVAEKAQSSQEAGSVQTPAAAVQNVADTEKLLRSAKDSLFSLTSAPEPYSLLAPFYQSLLEEEYLNVSKDGNVSANGAVVANNWKEVKAHSQRFLLELEELSKARAGLDKESTIKAAILRLQNLAKDAQFVRAPAVLTLLRIAESPQDKSAAISLGQDVAQQFPESSEKITDELKRLM